MAHGPRTARHGGCSAAALVAAWLLLAPPIRDAAPEPDAPLADWRSYGVFATSRECGRALDLMRRMTVAEKYGWERRYWNDFADCVREDD